MKYILPSYLLRELFKTFIPAFFGFGFLIILGLTIQLLHKGLDIIDIRVIIPYLMLYACPDALPISFLAATVMTYGRLSASNEIVAIRTGGVHLHVIVTPVIVIAFLLSILTLYLNAEVLPKSNSKIKLLREAAISSILTRHISTVKKKIVFEPYHIYIGKIEGDTYKKLAIIEYIKDFVTNILLAEEGNIVMSNDGQSIILTLIKGDFAKMNYQKPKDVPKVGTFDEMSFEIPINRKEIVATSKKYKTMLQLYEELKSINTELENHLNGLNSEEKKEVSSSLKKNLNPLNRKYNELALEKENVSEKIYNLNNKIENNKSKMENLKNGIHTIENQIAVSNINMEHLKRMADEGDEQSDLEANIDQINKTINNYSQDQKSMRKDLSVISKTIKDDEEALPDLVSRVSKLENKIASLDKKIETLSRYASLQNLSKSADEILVLIHKRLSSSFLCIAFALIGIPLGILTKSGNVLITFGISFLIVVLIYYPLSVVCLILSKSILPIIPALWGPIGIILILGIVLFRKSLKQ